MGIEEIENMEKQTAKDRAYQRRNGYADVDLIKSLVEYVESSESNYRDWRQKTDEEHPTSSTINDNLKVTVRDACKVVRLVKELDD